MSQSARNHRNSYPEDIEDVYPLTPLQQGMLFHALYDAQPGVDIEQLIFTIQADLDFEAFEAAWQRVVDRHAILRTSFHWEDLDEPQQRVHKNGRLSFCSEDWRTLSSDEQHQRLETYLQNDRKRGFELRQNSLMRVALFQLAEHDFYIVWSFHHILLDGRSFVHILDQVHAFHEGQMHGVPYELPPTRPFREHLEKLGQVDISAAEKFWRRTLQGFNIATPLPAGRPGTIALDVSPSHAEEAFRISADSTGSLKKFAVERGITLYTMVQAVWALLLGRYSREQDVVFGAIRACRSSADAGESVGLYINTVPVRVNIPGERTWIDWLTELRQQHLALRAYETTPLQKIHEWSELPGGSPLFENILVFENYDLGSLIQSHWSNWEIREFKLLEQTNYPISLSGWSGDELLLKIEYDEQRFERTAVTRMLGHISTMLEAMPSHIDQPVARLPMLTPAEHQQIVIDWNENPSPTIERSVVEMFESQVARTPDAIAVVSGSDELTYDQLNERANQLAHYLLSLGVKPETLVGISASRSLDMIVGLFGILKAGAAYLPIDPAYPNARVTEIVGDSCITILVTETRVLANFDRIKPTVICLDTQWQSIAPHSRLNPEPTANLNNLAYVIYTSGSTGGPKGVLIEHRSLAEYVDFAGREFDLTTEDRVLQFASSSFDTSAEEIFPTLARGATLVLRSDAMVSSISLFLERCSEWGITVLDLPTAFWHELTLALEDQELSLPDSVRLVIIGGERAQTQRLKQWHNVVPSTVRLLNTYGPTEATIVTTFADLSVPAATNDPNIDVSVGRPVPGAKIFILDNHEQPIPPGVTGELHIGGAGLARGYLGRPELTAEKFIADPFSRDPRRRLYKTGDLACYSFKGDIRICGRIDDQVKVNGYRIELSEIERVLCSSPSVRDAVILVKEDPSGTKQLLAYVVPTRANESLSQEQLFDQLNAFLAKKLPRHMLPSAILRLEELPVSANGKVDRTKLPAPHELRSLSPATYARPRDPLERQLVEIWEELLKVAPIGIKDDFFELGGHSLLSVRMISRVEQLTGERLSLATLFEDATIEHLAARILKQEKLKHHSRIIKVKDGGTRQPFFFFHGDFNGGGFYCLNLARGLSEDQPFYAVQPHGIDGNAIPITIEAMAKAHLKELREIQPRGPYLLGGYCNGAVISFEIARLIEAEGEKVDLLVLLCASVSNALRFRFLRNFVDCLSDVENLEAEGRLNRFLTYRARLLRIREIKNYYRTRISDFSRLPARERLSLVREKSLTAGSNLVRSLVSITNVDAQDGKQESHDHISAVDAHRERVSAAYAKAVLGYVPRQYHGKVTVLWPAELPLEEPEDPTAGWSKVAASVELLRVPGGHITCVTSHVEHVANALRVCLDEIANGSGYSVVQEGEAEDQAERGCEKSYDTITAFETVQNS